jgi:hypothetical protein
MFALAMRVAAGDAEEGGRGLILQVDQINSYFASESVLLPFGLVSGAIAGRPDLVRRSRLGSRRDAEGAEGAGAGRSFKAEAVLHSNRRCALAACTAALRLCANFAISFDTNAKEANPLPHLRPDTVEARFFFAPSRLCVESRGLGEAPRIAAEGGEGGGGEAEFPGFVGAEEVELFGKRRRAGGRRAGRRRAPSRRRARPRRCGSGRAGLRASRSRKPPRSVAITRLT